MELYFWGKFFIILCYNYKIVFNIIEGGYLIFIYRNRIGNIIFLYLWFVFKLIKIKYLKVYGFIDF